MAAAMERTKTPGIFKRGSRYVFVYRDHLGRQRKASAATLAEAKARRASSIADVSRGEHRSLSRVTFTEYAAEWIVGYTGRTARGIGADTRADYARWLGLAVDGTPLDPSTGAVAFFGRTRLIDIGPRDVRAYAAEVATRKGRTGKPVKAATVRLALAPLKAMLATAHEDELIRSNPTAGLRNLLPASEESGDEPVKAMTDAELTALLGALPVRWRLFFEFLAESGLRIGEAIEVRWGDVDLGQRWLAVDRRLYRGRVAKPKGRKTRRVRISEPMSRALWTLRKAAEAAGDGDLVFPSEKGHAIDQSNLMSRVLKPAARTAAVGDWVGFHAFRHTCATRLFRSGWNAAQVQRFLGHSDPGFTLRRYIHLLDEDMPEPVSVGGNEVATRAAERGRDEAAPVVAVSAQPRAVTG
jgi:integrase